MVSFCTKCMVINPLILSHNLLADTFDRLTVFNSNVILDLGVRILLRLYT